MFTLGEGYNIGAISYIGGLNPVVRVTYQTAFANANYGVVATARVISPTPAGSQISAVLNVQNQTSSYTDFVLQTCTTADQSTTGGTVAWNQYSKIQEIDIVVVDTRS